MSRTVAITGVNGYLGSALADHLLAAGWTVVALARTTPPARPGLTFRQFELGQKFPADVACDAVVHAAYDFRATSVEDIDRVNVQGSVDLLSSIPTGTYAVFVSTQSAASPQSAYGTAKRKVEDFCLARGIAVLRPGLIAGPGGLYSRLDNIARALPVIPLLGSGNQTMYVVRREDVCVAIETMITERLVLRQPVEFAHPTPYTFKELLRALAAEHGRRPLLVPVPLFLIRLGLRFAAMLGLNVGFREDNLNGLLTPPLPPDPMAVKVQPQAPIAQR